MIVKYDIKKAIFHWYTGKISTLSKILNYGFYLSINESMCKSKKGQNIISKLPKDKVLVETDAPFIKDILPYNNYQVYQYLADIWKIPYNKVIKIIYNNFNNLQKNNVTSLF
jgi:TatD DNase family protein